MDIAWHPHPDSRFETLLAEAPATTLQAALRQPPAAHDRYAHLRLLDRLRQLLPRDGALQGAWIQAMLLSNRPAPVHALTRGWPMQRGPDPSWRLVAAQVAQTMGARDEARARFRALVDADPGMVDAWQKFLEFEPRASAADLARVEGLHRDASHPYVREKAAFALASALWRDAPERALALVEEAHALKRRRTGAWKRVDVLRRMQLDRACVPQPGHVDATPVPLFIVGLPRSGTTLLTRMLGSHPDVVGVGEQNLVPNLATMLEQGVMAPAEAAGFAPAWYRAALGDLAGGARVVVDKLPANVEHIGLVLSLLPAAQVLWLQRGLRDCALSIHLRDFEFGCLYADDAGDLGDYAGLVRAHGAHWLRRAPERVMAMRYEDLVADPAASLAPLLQRLGLEWQPSMLDFWQRGEQIATYSEAQVRRPLHGDAIDGWQRVAGPGQAFFDVVEQRAGQAEASASAGSAA